MTKSRIVMHSNHTLMWRRPASSGSHLFGRGRAGGLPTAGGWRYPYKRHHCSLKVRDPNWSINYWFRQCLFTLQWFTLCDESTDIKENNGELQRLGFPQGGINYTGFLKDPLSPSLGIFSFSFQSVKNTVFFVNFESSQLSCQICFTWPTYSRDAISVLSDPQCHNCKKSEAS